MDLINLYYSESNDNKIWSCKCKCTTKKAHRTKWAFISMYKKNNKEKFKNNKKSQCVQTEIVDKTIDEVVLDQNEEILESEKSIDKNILYPKVRYDKILNKIVIDLDTQIQTDLEKNMSLNKTTINDIKQNHSVDCSIIKSNKLVELRNLLFG